MELSVSAFRRKVRIQRRMTRVLDNLFDLVGPRPAPSGAHLCDFDGVKVMLDFATPTHRRMFQRGTFEPALTAALRAVAEPGEAFVDIGANVGWHSLSLLKRRPDVPAAYAFEPSRAYSLLTSGIAANGLEGRCHPRRVALAAERTTANLKTFKEFGSTHASLFPLGDLAYDEDRVEVETLDQAAESFAAPPGLVKCDVEGGERDVLLGASGILAGKFGPPPIWFLEANYEAAGMAGYFPWQLVEIAAAHAPYRGYVLRGGAIRPMPTPKALRHGDTLVLGVPDLHEARFGRLGG